MADLAARLAAALGPDAVSTDPQVTGLYAVDGLVPRIWCAPQTAEQITNVIRLCADDGAAIIPWGGGTSMRLGNLPSAVDVVLNLHRLYGIVEHDDANLTATVRAGTPISAVQQTLAEGGQFLALDPPWRIRATVGGVVAAATNGPRRTAYGAVRDLVIGMRIVLGTGEAVKAGGKVVKNVAGYDLCKLFTGSLGTLGIITEVTFKLAPIPEAVAVLLVRGGVADVIALANDIRESPLLPVSMILSSDDPAGRASLLLRAEGFVEPVGRHVVDILALVRRDGLDGAVLDDADRDAAWRRVRDFPAVPESHAAYRVSVPVGSAGAAAAQIAGPSAAPVWAADLGTGTLWVIDPAPRADRFSDLQAVAGALGGHAVLAAAPPSMKVGIDVWGLAPPGAELMRGIKQQFDPHSLLNPGRFVLGL